MELRMVLIEFADNCIDIYEDQGNRISLYSEADKYLKNKIDYIGWNVSDASSDQINIEGAE